jgi:Holliday junction resolvase
MNINYRRGRAKEYRLKKKYEKEGFIVLRTSGSHGFADLIAINEKGEIIFIQAKPKHFPESRKLKLLAKYWWVDGIYKVEFIIE